MDKMREAFEEWLNEYGEGSECIRSKRDPEAYVFDFTNADWATWQAAWSAALAAKPLEGS